MAKYCMKALLLILLSCYGHVMAQAPSSDSKTAQSSGNSTAQLDLGHLEGTNYVNKFFGLSLSIPRDWVVVSEQRNKQVTEESRNAVKAEDQKDQSRVVDSIDRSTNLLSLTKLPAGQPNNASFMLIAERVPTAAIKTGTDVINALEETMKGTNFKVEFQGGVNTERISNTDFAVTTIKNTSPYGVFKQKMYVTVKGDYALELFLTFTDDADVAVFDAIAKSIKFK